MRGVRFLSPSLCQTVCRRSHLIQQCTSKRTFSTPKADYIDPEDQHAHDPPTWSLEDLFANQTQGREPTVSLKELHHLLRLSALPMPNDLAEEHRMQKELQSQLRFVKAIQEIEIPKDVKPLQSIRDETEEGIREQEIGCETLKDEFKREEVMGIRGRIKRRKDVKDKKADSEEEEWNPLALAPRKVGRYIAVNTAKD
ncbi:MAG: hypothetical protein Q9218_006376 [Villophora microphyllina]